MDDYVKTRIIPKIELYNYIENYKIKYYCIPFKTNNIKIIIFLKESNHILNVLLNNKNIIDLEDELNNMTTYAYVGKVKVILKYLPELE
jgi:serine protease inhibitor